jgi:hypothetical protein
MIRKQSTRTDLPLTGESRDALEREHGVCPLCATPAKLRTCWECCESAWIIDCADFPQPRPISFGRADGSEPQRLFCEDCAEALSGRRTTTAC